MSSQPAEPAGPPQGDRFAAVSVPRLMRAGGGVALIALLLGTKWYGVDLHVNGDLGQGGAGAVSGWKMLEDLRWLVLVAGALSVASALAPPLCVASGLLCAVTAVALFVRLLIWVPDASAVVDIKAGAYLALVAAAAGALGASRTE